VNSPPAARKALLFQSGPVRLALRLSHVREILPAQGCGEVVVRGERVAPVPVAVALGVAPGAQAVVLAIESSPRTALCVDAVHGIVDLAQSEVFQLPARTILPRPSPFHSAIVAGGEVALELAVGTLGWAPIEPAVEPAGALPEHGRAPEAELLFTRGARTFAVPLSLLVRVLDAPRVHPVPLTPPSHLGLVVHGRALHPVVDPAALYGEPAGPGPVASALLLDAGGAPVGLAADRILQAGGAGAQSITRPSWDALFAA
jgi:chemotaxis signal transduction protein